MNLAVFMDGEVVFRGDREKYGILSIYLWLGKAFIT